MVISILHIFYIQYILKQNAIYFRRGKFHLRGSFWLLNIGHCKSVFDCFLALNVTELYLGVENTMKMKISLRKYIAFVLECIDNKYVTS